MILAATDLFHLQGIKGTSIDEVLKRSGTGKSQFSHYFKNKDGLVRAVVEHLHAVIRSGQAPTGYDVETWDDFDQWFAKYISFQRAVDCERSCPLGTIGHDLAPEQVLLRQEVKLFFEWCRGRLARFFAERRAAKELDPSVDPDSLAHFCLTVMEGGMLLAKIERDTAVFESAAAHALAYVHSLRRRPSAAKAPRSERRAPSRR